MTEFQLREITCRRDLTNANFPRGVQDFDFSIGRPSAWVPNRSYFLLTLSLTGSGGSGTKPNIEDGVAFADDACACLFDNCYFRAGGQDVSSIVQFLPQAHASKTRLMKTGAWLETMGDGAYLHDADFNNRVNKVSATDSKISTTDVGTYSKGTLPANYYNATVEYVALTGEIKGISTAFVSEAINVGDALTISGNTYVVHEIVSDTSLYVLSSAQGFDIAATGNYYFTTGKVNPRSDLSRNKIYVAFQPPVGIFQHDGVLGAGDYRFQLNPNANYKKSAVEAISALATIGTGIAITNYNIEVEDMKFYAGMINTEIPNQIEDLHLKECLVQSKTATNNTTLEFSVPSSTFGLAVWAQSNDAGSNPQVPPTMFKCKDDSDLKLTQIQITYANVTKPSTKWSSEFDPIDQNIGNATSSNLMVQRYHDTLAESGLGSNPAGCETLNEYLKRGPIYYYSFERDASNMATQVQLQINFSTLEADAKVFLGAFYTRSTRITTSNGMVASVITLAI